MGTLQAVYSRDANGQEPVQNFIDELDVETQVAIDNQVDRLNLLSDEIPHLPFPHSSQVEGELRCHYGRSHYRVLYRRSGSRSPASAGSISKGEWTPAHVAHLEQQVMMRPSPDRALSSSGPGLRGR
jgi:hypothetical protein